MAKVTINPPQRIIAPNIKNPIDTLVIYIISLLLIFYNLLFFQGFLLINNPPIIPRAIIAQPYNNKDINS
ncbi:hypothetical protein UT300016_05310 [Clostridium senegalense]